MVEVLETQGQVPTPAQPSKARLGLLVIGLDGGIHAQVFVPKPDFFLVCRRRDLLRAVEPASFDHYLFALRQFN